MSEKIGNLDQQTWDALPNFQSKARQGHPSRPYTNLTAESDSRAPKKNIQTITKPSGAEKWLCGCDFLFEVIVL